jgi:succinate-semialdehyde dehydrogenase / glutarate-semialdehyde dehydrogenase
VAPRSTASRVNSAIALRRRGFASGPICVPSASPSPTFRPWAWRASGARIGEAGNFWQPTVLADVPREAKVFNDEPFGPMAAIRSFDTLDEAIAEANRLPYGLAGYAFTRSLKNADLLARRVEVGMLWINMPAMPSAEMPFGGVKDSGYGSEGGPEAVEAYLNVRAVAVMNV